MTSFLARRQTFYVIGNFVPITQKESSATSALPSFFLNLYAVCDFFSKRHPLILHPYDQTVRSLRMTCMVSPLHVMLAQKIDCPAARTST